jgi:hypothetical protein
MLARVPAREPSLGLAELIDLELRFAADRSEDRKRLRERDERLGRELAARVSTEDRHGLFRHWLLALRDGDGATPGERVETGYRLLGAALGVIGLVLGAGAARTVLGYDGTHPVNVVHFLAVFVFAQLGMVALALFAMIPRLWPGRWRDLSPLQELLRQINLRRTAVGAVGAMSQPRQASLVGRLAAIGSLHARVERWALSVLTQRTAFLFNLGALATCLYLIAFTDLAFAWSTTLDVDSERMWRLLRAVALPWSWLDVAVPTRELVEQSRYFRKTGSYDPRALKDWWAFLLAALATYGLLPRLVLWSFASWRMRAARAATPLDHGDAQTAFDRLTRGSHGWAGADASGAERDDEVRAVDPKRPNVALPPATAQVGCTVVRWADVPVSDEESAAMVAQRFGWRADNIFACGGRDGVEQRQVVINALAREAAANPVVVLAEAWEAPSRAVTGFLAGIRRAVDARKPVVVGLLGGAEGSWTAPADADRSVWERSAAALGDPYLRVESVTDE